METRAAVLREAGTPLSVETIELAAPAPDQVVVDVRASGVCHSDLSVVTGTLPFPTPVVLGHEGAGVVAEVGSAVTRVRPGDHVILNWASPCRTCFHCRLGEAHLCERAVPESFTRPYATLDGERVYCGLGTAGFAERTLVGERSVVRVGADVPFEVAALVGCAVATGVGAACTTARLRPGATVAVVGCGGVGQSVLLGAALCGAAAVVAVDRSAERLGYAERLGASATVGADGDVEAAVRELTGGRGVDAAFEVVGSPETIRLAWRITRRGGTTVVVGAGPATEQVAFTPFELFYDAKRLLGCVYGSSDPDRDFPLLVGLYRAGRLPLDALVTRRIGLADVDDAFRDMQAGTGVRSVIVPG